MRFAPNTTYLCGKLEQIPDINRKYYYFSSTKKPEVELYGRPTFAVFFRIVDYCHDVLLTGRDGSFQVGPTDRLWCSYTIHLPYGNRVAVRLQLGTGPIDASSVSSISVIREDYDDVICKGMALTLEDGDSQWRHCSKPGDPLRNVQIVSEQNIIRLNISVLGKKGISAMMWLKLWWMDKPIEDIMGQCDYGWVSSEEFCISAFRETKKSWIQSENECKSLGGHLASILNDKHQHNVDQLLIHT